MIPNLGLGKRFLGKTNCRRDPSDLFELYEGCRSAVVSVIVIQEFWRYDRREVKDISYTRRALSFLCRAVILSTALANAGVNLLLAILVPIWFFLAAVVILLLPGIDEHYDIEPYPFLPVLSPRPPPAARLG